MRKNMVEKKPEEYLKALSMPNLCARCGTQPGESAWPIFSRYNFSFKLARTTYKKSRFYVPVCNTCQSHLEQDNALWLKVSWGSGIGALAMIALAILIYEYSGTFLIFSLLALIVLLVAYIKRSKYWQDSGIASYDGKVFTFHNKTFQGKFAELNPHLVKKG